MMRINSGYSYSPTTNNTKPQAQTRQNSAQSHTPILFGSDSSWYPIVPVVPVAVIGLFGVIAAWWGIARSRRNTHVSTNSPSYYDQQPRYQSYDLEQRDAYTGYQQQPEGYPPQAHYPSSHY